MQADPVFLGLDTATAWLCAALWSPAHGELARIAEQVERDHAKRMTGVLDALLLQAGLDKTRLSGIGVGIGPGSYTGLRVGVATAAGLGRGLGIPVAGADTLASAARSLLAEDEEAFVTLDARRGNVYAGRYHRRGDIIRTLAQPRKIHLETLLAEAAEPGIRVLTDVRPDAAWLAQQALSGLPPVPSYL
jgi:tRNA threonylcarbamoyladenosine biosynthesis protein TsaB